MFLLPLLVGCAAEVKTDEPSDVIGTYEMGWPIDACSETIDPEGTGHAIGDQLPAFSFLAQTGETVNLHDFCGRPVFIELGYFT